MRGMRIDEPAGMTPLRVVAHLGDAVASFDEALPLDALLAHGQYVLLPVAERAAMPKVDFEPEPADFDLPLARWRVEGDDGRLAWGWVCTHAMGIWHRGMVEVRRRYPYGPLLEMTDAGKVTPGAGPEKAIDKPVPTLLAREMTWYCVGRKDLVRRLIRVIPAIGKLRGHGHGTVLRWEVGRAPGVTADWILERRRLPAAVREGAAQKRAIRPPYWHRGQHTDCVEPDAALLRVAG